jgi:Trypsin-co-occurring domain 1
VPADLMRMQADDGTSVLIEIEPVDEGFGDIAFDGAVARAKQTLEQTLGDIRAMAFKALDAFRTGDSRRPDTVELEFGVKFKAEAGAAVFAKTAAEGHLVVRLTWSDEPGGAEPDHP